MGNNQKRGMLGPISETKEDSNLGDTEKREQVYLFEIIGLRYYHCPTEIRYSKS